MKQENLDELKNIYLGLVTGGEGPEVLSEAGSYNVKAEEEAIKKRILMRDVNILAQPQWLDLELYNEPSASQLSSINHNPLSTQQFSKRSCNDWLKCDVVGNVGFE